MNGQASVEYILIIAVVMAIVIPAVTFYSQTSNSAINSANARNAIDVIASAADRLYKSGGGRIFVYVDIPENVVSTYIGNKTIIISFLSSDGISDALITTEVNISGNIPAQAGRYKIFLEMVSGTVLIYEKDTYPPIIISTQPSGTIPQTNVTLIVLTNENAACRYCSSFSCSSSTDFSLMQNMQGSGILHNILLTLSNGSHTFYSRCNDTSGNVMNVSSVIGFIINTSTADTVPPYVNNTTADRNLIFVGDYVCVGADAVDNIAIDDVWLSVSDPNGNVVNRSLSSTGCRNGFSSSIQLTASGNYTIITSFANDTSGNTNSQTPNPNIIITVLPISFNLCRTNFPCADIKDVGVDELWFLKSENLNDTDKSATSLSWRNITLDVLDDDKNTPTEVIRFGNNYESFVARLRNESSIFRKVTLYGRVSRVDADPFLLRVFPYKSDGININTSYYADFSISPSILQQPVKWIELDVTNLTLLESGFGFIRLRITSLNNAAQSGRAFQFSELHYKVG